VEKTPNDCVSGGHRKSDLKASEKSYTEDRKSVIIRPDELLIEGDEIKKRKKGASEYAKSRVKKSEGSDVPADDHSCPFEFDIPLFSGDIKSPEIKVQLEEVKDFMIPCRTEEDIILDRLETNENFDEFFGNEGEDLLVDVESPLLPKNREREDADNPFDSSL
jgi:hypothetical protein